MTSAHASPTPSKRPNGVAPVSIVGAVVVVLAVALGVWLFPQNATPSAKTPRTTAPKAAVVETYAAATFSDWATRNGADETTGFSVQSTGAHDGKVALRIDNPFPASMTSRRSLTQQITVMPGTNYQITAWVRSAATPGSTAFISVGTDPIDRFNIPSTHGSWKQVTFTFAAKKAAEVPLAVVTASPTVGLLIDQLQFTPTSGGESLLTNGSFEEYSSPTRIANETLVLATGSAKLDVAGFGDYVKWEALDESGGVAATGKHRLVAGAASIPLKSLSQGYYDVSIHVDDHVANSVKAPVIVLDRPAKGRETTDDRIGIGIHMRSSNNVGSEPLVSALGFGTVRDDANWGQIEPSAGSYSFPDVYEKTYAIYKKAGVRVLPIVGYWNKHYDRGRTPDTPAGIAAYANYASAFVGHYGSPAVEIYNEFNGFANGACGKTPECYLPLLQAAFTKIKGDHPNTTVIGPAIAFQDNTWLDAFYKAGGLNFVDAVSFHPYGLQSPPEYLATDLPAAVAAIKQHNNGVSKPLWVTELGFTTNTTGNGISERAQGDYLVRAEILSLASGAQKYYYYDLVNDKVDPADHEANFGLFREPTNDVAAFAPKPAAMAQAVAIRAIAGRAYTGRDPIGAHSYSYAFGTGADTTRVAWSPTPTTVSYAAKKAVKLTTQYGRSVTLQPKNGHVTVRLSGEPVYLEGGISGASTNVTSIASMTPAKTSVPQGAGVQVTFAVDLTGQDSAARTVEFTIDGGTHKVNAARGKVTKKTVTLPGSFTLGLRTINTAVGDPGKPDTYLTASTSVTIAAPAASPPATETPRK